MSGGAHTPPCLSLEDHIEAARHEAEGFDLTVDDFVYEVRHDWAVERQSSDAEASIRYWQKVEADWLAWAGVSQ